MATKITAMKTIKVAEVDEQDSRVPRTTKCELVDSLIEHLTEKMTIGERLEFFAELETIVIQGAGTAGDDLANHKDRDAVVKS